EIGFIATVGLLPWFGFENVAWFVNVAVAVWRVVDVVLKT
ncbi:13667_t:CDS:1, partial [Ambispora leptoticha]